MEQRNANIEIWPNLLPAHARLGQNRFARIKTQTVLRVSRPSARIQIEEDVIAAIVPRGQPMQPSGDIPDVVIAERVPIQGVDGQHEEAGSRWIAGVVSTLGDGGQDLLVVVADWWCGCQISRVIVQRIDVDEEFVVAASEVETGFHAAGTCGECGVKEFFIVLGLGEGVVVLLGMVIWLRRCPDERGKFVGIANRVRDDGSIRCGRWAFKAIAPEVAIGQKGARYKH